MLNGNKTRGLQTVKISWACRKQCRRVLDRVFIWNLMMYAEMHTCVASTVESPGAKKARRTSLLHAESVADWFLCEQRTFLCFVPVKHKEPRTVAQSTTEAVNSSARSSADGVEDAVMPSYYAHFRGINPRRVAVPETQ